MNLANKDVPLNDQVLISVLMPVFNAETYLIASIESVLNQSYSNFEFVIVNDGSTDSTADILTKYEKEDSRIVLITQQNKGIVEALNVGLVTCTGAYIARMDADDICYSDRLERQLYYFATNKDCVLVGGQANIIDKNGCVISGNHDSIGRQHKKTNMKVFPPKVVDSTHPLIMIKADAIRAIGGYRASFPHAEDYDLFIRLSSQGRLLNPNDIMIQYRVHEESLSQKNMRLQEASATLAELTAMWSVRTHGTTNAPLDCPEKLVMLKRIRVSNEAFEAYQNYRLWKRTEISHLHKYHPVKKTVLATLFDSSLKSLWDLSLWKIRLHILGTILYRWFVILRSTFLDDHIRRKVK